MQLGFLFTNVTADTVAFIVFLYGLKPVLSSDYVVKNWVRTVNLRKLPCPQWRLWRENPIEWKLGSLDKLTIFNIKLGSLASK